MAKRLNATIDKETKQLLINDFGYEPVDLESYTGQIRALKESFNTLQIKDPKDARLRELAIAIKNLRADREVEKDDTGTLKRNRKRRSDSKSAEQIKAEIDAKDKAIADRKAKKKKDAMNFISPGSTPPALPPAESESGGDMSGVLTKIAGDVNIIKGIVASQEKLEKDKTDDTREAREKSKREKAENMLETGRFKKVANVIDKALTPVKGIFSKIFDFLKLFLFGAAVMKLLDWFGNPDNKGKIDSLFKFLKDWWPALVAVLMALFPGFALIPGIIALTVGFLPKLIDTVKSILGFNKQIDKEIKDQEKDYEKNERGVAFDTKLPDDPDKSGDQVTPTPTVEGGGQEGKNVATPQPFNKGGEVPGQGDTDTVPAMLTPGEFVLTKDAVKKYGTDTLYGMNAAAGGVDKSNDVPRGPSGKPIKKTMKKKSTVQTMMDMGGLNPINNISKSMNNVTNNTSNNISKPTSDVTNNSLSNMTNNISKSNVTNNITETMNMSGGGMTKNMSYMGGGGMTKNTSYMNSGGMTKNTSYMNSGGMVTNNVGETSNVQYMKLGGMVKNFISKTPQARVFNFAKNQLKKLPVPPPLSRMASKIPKLEFNLPNISGGADSLESKDEIPSFNVTAPGGYAKEQTLGIRR